MNGHLLEGLKVPIRYGRSKRALHQLGVEDQNNFRGLRKLKVPFCFSGKEVCLFQSSKSRDFI